LCVRTPKLPPRGTLRRRLFDRVTRLQVRLYRLSGGRIGGRYRYGTKVLILEHVGRRSGQLRTAPLVYYQRGDDLIVVASAGASDVDPQWLLNLRAQPETHVSVGSERRAVLAQVADVGEKAALWPELIEHNPEWDDYTRRTDRDIPVVVLRPAPAGADQQ
jgi:deazaflavin-dependent oxidoreductase (nitroreductase family)